MSKNILVAVDLSHVEKSSKIVEQAKSLAEQGDDVRLTLLNVVAEIPAYVAAQLPSDLHKQVMDNAAADLNNLIKEHGLPDSTKIRIEHGNPAKEILSIANKQEIDLVLIASHQPGMSDYLLGSVAGKVVRHARCSVLVIR